MQTQTEMQREVDEAVRTMRAGGIILYPTDTVWGLGCDATSAAAVERIYRLKRSGNKKSMLVLCASADMIVDFVVNPRFEGKPTRKASSIIAFGEGGEVKIIRE